MRPTLKTILGVLLLSALGALGWWIFQAEKQGVFEILVIREKPPLPDREKYEVLVADLERWRNELAKAYESASSPEAKRAIEQDARLILEFAMPEMMRCWLGTPYDFNGIAEHPGEEKVACGYFVSTVIRDAGFRINRYKLAQQPSENIMRTFLASDNCLLRVGKPYAEYADWLETMDPGIYLVGLDTHVGFIVNEGHQTRFIHASGMDPWAVVDEGREQAGALQRSNWRMLGGFTTDPEVIRTWLSGDRIKVRK